MNIWGSGGSPEPWRSSYEALAKLQEDPYYKISNEKADGINTQDYFLTLARENEILRMSNQELTENIADLQARLSDYKTQPIRVENSPEQSARILRLETERERLLNQLREKTEQFEELKLKTRDLKDGMRLETTIENIRRELHVQLREEYEHKARRTETSMDLVHRDLDEARLNLNSKEKEVELLEQSLKGMERRTLDDMESMRSTITQALWQEYEKKLNAKKEEFDSRCQMSLDEIDRLNGLMKEWRKKCIELEEKNMGFYTQMNHATDRDLDLKRAVAGYEDRILNLERQLERSNQLQSESQSQSSISRDKIKLLEGALTDLEEKKLKFDEAIMEREAQVKALNKELERCRSESHIWKQHLEKSEAENSKSKLRILDLENNLRNTDKFKDNSTNELVWEKANYERAVADFMASQAELKSALVAKEFLEHHLKKAREDAAFKHDLIEEYKKVNSNVKDGFQNLVHDHATLKAQSSRDREVLKLLSNQVEKLSIERQEMAVNAEVDKIKQVRTERSSLNMLVRPNYSGDTETKIYKQKLEESETQLKSMKVKISQLSAKSTEIISEGLQLVTENNELAKRNEILQKQLDLIKLELQETKMHVEKKEADRQSAMSELQMANKLNQFLENSQKDGEANSNRMRSLDEELARLRQQIDQQNILINKYKDEIVEKEKLIIINDPRPINEKIYAIISEKNVVVETLKDVQGELRKVTDSAQNFQRQSEVLAARNQDLEKECINLRSRATETMTDNKQRSEEHLRIREESAGIIGKLRADNDAFQREIQGLKTVITRLEQIQTQLQTQLSQPQPEAPQNVNPQDVRKEEIINKLQERIVDFQKSDDNLQNYIKNLLQTNQMLVGQANAANAQLEKVQYSQAAQPQPISQAQFQNQSLAPNLAQEKGPNSGQDLTQGVGEEGTPPHDERIIQLEMYVKELQEEMDFKDRIIKRNEDSLQLHSGDLGLENQQMAHDIEFLKALADKLSNENDNLRHANASLIGEVDIIRNDNTSLSDQIQNMKKSQQPSSLQLKSTDTKSNNLMIENQQLMSEIQKIMNTNRELLEKNHELQKNVTF